MARQGKNNKGPRVKTPLEFEQRVIDLARVTRVMAGGKRLRFRACVALGDKNGKVGWAVAKGADVTIAVNKAASKAKKKLVKVKLIKGTIPHLVVAKFKAAKVLLKPAKEGTGIIAGGAVRSVLELAGISNIYGKILGKTNNKINNITATFKALKNLKYPTMEKKEIIEEEKKDKAEEIELEVYPERDLIHEEELEKEQEKLLKKVGVKDEII